LDDAAKYFSKAGMYEAVNGVYKVSIFSFFWEIRIRLILWTELDYSQLIDHF
jgi:hypothetical protein